jgi:hypothetical protein
MYFQGRVLVLFLLGPIALIEPIAHAYVRMKDFDPYTQTVHTHTRTLPPSVCLSNIQYSPVLLRRVTQACRCQPHLSSCCTTRPHRGVGMRASIHAGSNCLHLEPSGSLANPALVAPSNPPSRQTTTPQNAPAIAQQRQGQRQRLPIARRCHGRMGENVPTICTTTPCGTSFQKTATV